MTKEIKALMVFCEGQHDVAFVSKVMRNFFGFSRVSWKFSEYPSPFNELLRANVEKHAAQDLSLNNDRPFLPSQVLAKDNDVALLFGCGGNRADKVKDLLSDFLPLLTNAKIFPGDATSVTDSVHYLFLYDADDRGANKIRQETVKTFTQVDEIVWLSEWLVDEENPFAATSGDKAIYIWGKTPEQGTLEDLLHPLFERCHPTLFKQASDATDQMFDCWKIDSSELAVAIPAISKRHKAIITIMGQHKKPGGAMSVILDQAKMIKPDDFKNSSEAKAFANFIARFAKL